MKIGDEVIHRGTGQRLTVKDFHGSAMVLCCFMGNNWKGERVECRAAFNWQDLRPPTADELAADGSVKAVPQTEALPNPPADGAPPPPAAAPQSDAPPAGPPISEAAPTVGGTAASEGSLSGPVDAPPAEAPPPPPPPGPDHGPRRGKKH